MADSTGMPPIANVTLTEAAAIVNKVGMFRQVGIVNVAGN